jgi:hypothetical protein
MAATLVDTAVIGGGESARAASRCQVVIDDLTIYVFSISNTGDVAYWKTTDGGETWGAPVSWGQGTTDSQWYDIYYEKWNGSGGRNIVHLAHHHDAGTRGLYYRQLDLDTDTLTTAVLAISLGGSPDNGTHGFGLGRDGSLYLTGSSLATGIVASRSIDDGQTWASVAGKIAEFAQQDQIVVWADFSSADPADLSAIYWDDSASELSLKRLDVSADSVTETAFGTSMDKPADSAANLSTALDRGTGHIYVAALDVAGAGSNNLKTWDVYGATATATTNVLSATTFVQCVALGITSAGIQCYYGRDASAASLASIEIYYKRSTDTMVTWGTETAYTSRDTGGTYRIMVDPYSVANVFAPVWEEDTGDDLYIEAPASIHTLTEQFRLMLSDGVDPDVPVTNITSYNIPGSPLVKTERGRDSAVLGNPPRAGQASLTLNNQGLHWGLDAPTPGLAVRLNKFLDGAVYHMWQGNLDIPGHTMTPFRPTVTVRALGTLTKLASKKVTTSLYTNIKVGAAIGHLLDAADFPSHLRDLDAGEVTLLYWWCSEADAMGELQKLVNSEGITADLYEQGDGKIVFRSRSARYTETRSTAIQTTFNTSVGSAEPLLTDFEYVAGFHEIVNKATYSRVTRLIDADPSVVWSEAANYLLVPNQAITIWATSSQPFTGAITPVLDTDYNVAFGSVTVSLDRTSGSRVGITFTAGASGAAFGYNNTTLTAMQLRATSIPQLGSDILEQQTIDTSASIAAYGVRAWQGEMSKELDWATMRDNLDAIVTWKQNPRGRIRFTLEAARSTEANEAVAKRELGDRIRIVQPDLDFDGECWIERIEHEINAPAGPVDGTVVGREISTYECIVVQVAVGSSGSGVGANPYDGIDNSVYVLPGVGFDEAFPAPSRLLANVI